MSAPCKRRRGPAREAAAARNRAKQWRTDLGLAVSALSLLPGEWRSAKVLAEFCECSHQALEQIEYRAILKVRRALKKRYGIVSSSFYDLVLRA
jgi:hypothetical protein